MGNRRRRIFTDKLGTEVPEAIVPMSLRRWPSDSQTTSLSSCAWVSQAVDRSIWMSTSRLNSTLLRSEAYV